MLYTERHQGKIRGTLNCFDRVIITGTLPDFVHAQAAARHVRMRIVKIFDFGAFAKPLRDRNRDNAERLAQEAGLTIEFLREPESVRKETLCPGSPRRTWPRSEGWCSFSV
jgi:hypothetical protein